MSSAKRASAAEVLAVLARGTCLAAVVAMAGCSSDVTRFSFSSFLGGEAPPPDAGPVGFAPASGPVGYAPPGRGPSDGFGLQESSLPPVKQVAAAPPRPAWTAKPPERPAPLWRDEPSAWKNDPPPWKDGDPYPVPESSVGRDKLAHPGAEPSPGWRGRYTMKAGDSLYSIAQHHKVNLEELKRANRITDVSKVRVGSVIAIPERTATAASSLAPAAIPPRVVQVKPQMIQTPEAKPAWTPAPASKIAAAPPKIAAASPTLSAPQKTVTQDDSAATDTPPAAAATDGRFRWPAQGKIIARFGPQPNGVKNEGITLAVPMGTGIHAAEAGRVHYVGDGLKGYGNLILIRHPNGWVSAYAHADKMFVKVGDQVKRGQVIGTVGKTGPVSQPQLRFELRKGTVPVDPLQHLGN